MKIGLLADIHGNALALEAVLRRARKEGVEQLLIAGDFVGYYYDVAGVMELLDAWQWQAISGNHEAMLVKARQSDDVLADTEARYGTGIRSALNSLDKKTLERLCILPSTLQCELAGRHFYLCHGSPWDTDLYVYPDADDEILERCASFGEIVVMGHTHYPMLKAVNESLIINPGSVGQPRDRHPGACWALLDTDTLKVSFRRESYDLLAQVEQARINDPDLPYLAEVLIRT